MYVCINNRLLIGACLCMVVIWGIGNLQLYEYRRSMGAWFWGSYKSEYNIWMCMNKQG